MGLSNVSDLTLSGVDTANAANKRKRIKNKNYAIHSTMSTMESSEKVQRSSFRRLAAKAVTSKRFETAVAAVIVLNVVYMCYATNYMIMHPKNPETKELRLISLAFAVVYCLELALKLLAYGERFLHPPDRSWNLFDSALVAQCIFEEFSYWFGFEAPGGRVGFLRALRLGKLVKMLRVVRLMRSMREMRLILVSMLGSLNGMFWSFLLIAAVLCLFSLIFVQACADELIMIERDLSGRRLGGLFDSNTDSNADASDISDRRDLMMKYFKTVQRGMGTLFLAATGGMDYDRPADMLYEVAPMYYGLFCLYIAFFLCVLMNTITALFVETTCANANKDHQYNITAVLEKKEEYVNALSILFEESDLNGDGLVSAEEFRAKMDDPKMRAFAESLHIEIADAAHFFRILAENGTTAVDIKAFVDACVRMKGQALSVDLQDLMMQHKFLSKQQSAFEKGYQNQMQHLIEASSSLRQEMAKVSMVLTGHEGYPIPSGELASPKPGDPAPSGELASPKPGDVLEKLSDCN
jgi:hypothetical protein